MWCIPIGVSRLEWFENGMTFKMEWTLGNGNETIITAPWRMGMRPLLQHLENGNETYYSSLGMGMRPLLQLLGNGNETIITAPLRTCLPTEAVSPL